MQAVRNNDEVLYRSTVSTVKLESTLDKWFIVKEAQIIAIEINNVDAFESLLLDFPCNEEDKVVINKYYFAFSGVLRLIIESNAIELAKLYIVRGEKGI